MAAGDGWDATVPPMYVCLARTFWFNTTTLGRAKQAAPKKGGPPAKGPTGRARETLREKER